MRTKKVWTVVWTSSQDTDEVTRFGNKADAVAFCAGKRHYSELADPFCEEVPSHIAKRWGF